MNPLGGGARRWTHLAFLPLLVSAGSAQERPAAVLVREVSVVDVERAAVRSGQDVLVVGDRIAAVGPTGSLRTRVPAGARAIDGRGLFAMPGLTDMHVHLAADDLPLLLANGVTTVRVLNGSPAILALRDSVRRGLRPGPRIVTSGPLLAGAEQPWRHELVTGAADAEAAARAQVRAGYDALKVYDGLSPEAYQAIVGVGAEAGVPVVGHVPEAVGLDWVLSHGQATIEHAEQIVAATVGHDLDRSRLPDIVRRVAASGVAVTPTLAAVEILSRRATPWLDSLFAAPEMRYADPSLRGWWGTVREGRPFPEQRREAWIAFHRALTRALAEAGVPILVGTDASNPLLVPGFAIHRELAALERAGLDRASILRAATAGAAAQLGSPPPAGVLAEGAPANLLLLAGNPLDDLGHLGRLRGVVVRGEWLDAERLGRMLDEVAERRSSRGGEP